MRVDDKLYVDWETGDRITVAVLKDAYVSISGQLNDPEQVEATHPEDLKYYTQLIPALKVVLYFFGEKV